jgi:OmpA-OmpF porin, OOP family
MKNNLKLKVWAFACWLAFVTVTNAQQVTPGVTEPLGAGFKVPHLLVKEQSRLVFYRTAAGAGAGVASIYINGVYQASLQAGAFSEVCLPPSSVEVGARMVTNGVQARNDMDVVNSLILKGGDDLFVRVSEPTAGRAMFVAVRPEQALPELVKLRAQQHTVSRVPNAAACQDAPKTAMAPVKPAAKESSMKVQTITLEADALFDFGKSDVGSIPPKGQRILGHLVDRIKTEFGRGDRVRIQIVGFADSFGSDATNMRLSKERAAAIKTYFVQGGLSASSIKTDGRGDKGRVITTCGTKLTPENVACNKPNRRVVVTVFGTPASETKE